MTRGGRLGIVVEEAPEDMLSRWDLDRWRAGAFRAAGFSGRPTPA
jgi:hypothetical protein